MIRAWVAASLACGLVALPAVADDATNNSDVVPVESVIRNVTQALAVAQNELEAEGLPRVKHARLQLETVYSTGLDGGTSLFIIKVGSPYDINRIQTLTLDLNPRRARAERLSARELEESLSELIVSAARGADNIRMDPTPLKLSAAAAKLSFVVKKAGAGGLGYSIAPVTVELDANLAASSVQSLTVSFADDN